MLNPFRATLAVSLLSAIALGTGCTAARTGLQLQAAAEARDAALAKRAPELAPYEYAMAVHYLGKAWEEAGHGEHRFSVQLAQKSMEWTDQALVQIGKGPRRLDLPADEIPAAPTTTPRPLPETPPGPMPEPSLPAPPEVEGL